ncbi:MAG: formylglycine-generating enzyme family protein, partial [Nitrospinota bacterium]
MRNRYIVRLPNLLIYPFLAFLFISVSVYSEERGVTVARTVRVHKNQWIQEVFELKKEYMASLTPATPPQINIPPLEKRGKGRLRDSNILSMSKEMILIPASEFLAGEPDLLKGMFIKEFYIDKYEVTQREYKQVMGDNPSYFKCDDCPVENVIWYEADEYCRRVGKRLPTEWEWEKAAKGGTTTKFYWGDSEIMSDVYAWYYENSGSKTHPVGQKNPNAYGLYDMLGNVWEWTSSDYGSKN